MQMKLKIQTVIFTLLFCLVSMSGMIVYAGNKVITIADVAQDQVADTKDKDGQSSDGRIGGIQLQFAEDGGGEFLCIPLKEATKAENIVMENHYMNRELWIYIYGTQDGFYEEQQISGNLSAVNSGTYEYTEGVSLLKFGLNEIYECRNVLKEGNLYIAFDNPGDIYERIIVIDPGDGGEARGYEAHGCVEKDINLDIAKRLKQKLDTTDIKVYYTRMDDSNPSSESRIGIANSVRADLFISIHAGGDPEDAAVYGTETVYNQEYFIPGFGSIELADIVEREVVTSISGRGIGLAAATEETEILEARVPAALLRTGYITNKQEAALLSMEDYRERIAEGLYNAIVKAYE